MAVGYVVPDGVSVLVVSVQLPPLEQPLIESETGRANPPVGFTRTVPLPPLPPRDTENPEGALSVKPDGGLRVSPT